MCVCVCTILINIIDERSSLQKMNFQREANKWQQQQQQNANRFIRFTGFENKQKKKQKIIIDL